MKTYIIKCQYHNGRERVINVTVERLKFYLAEQDKNVLDVYMLQDQSMQLTQRKLFGELS